MDNTKLPKFLKSLTDNGIKYDHRFVKYAEDRPKVLFKGMKIVNFKGVIITLFYDLDSGVYRSSTNDLESIKEVWNPKIERELLKYTNMGLLMNKI